MGIKEETKCENCGKKFPSKISKNKFFTKRFCGVQCRVAVSRRKAYADGDRCDNHKWQRENPERYKASIKKNYDKNKNKWHSRHCTTQLVRRGSINIIKECNICKSECKLETHHDTYPTKKLEIQKAIDDGKIYYLCKKCHGKKRIGSKNSK